MEVRFLFELEFIPFLILEFDPTGSKTSSLALEGSPEYQIFETVWGEPFKNSAIKQATEYKKEHKNLRGFRMSFKEYTEKDYIGRLYYSLMQVAI